MYINLTVYMQTFYGRALGLITLLCLLTSAAWAQTVTGTVTDSDGIGLPGVNVIVVGTSSGTVTDLDGNYSLTADDDAMLRFSYIGFEAQEVAVDGRSSIDITLGADANVMDEVVVVGYGSQRREAVTGAVSSIGSEEISELTVANLGEAIQGRLAGVQVIGGGQPGSTPIIQVRGIGSINFGSGPLYVVDGIPGAGGLNQFDSRDIASVNVLKDAAASAVYGSRASNGVIIIETKKGKGADGIQLSLESTVGVQTQPRRYDVLNTDQYIAYAQRLNNGMPLARDFDEIAPGTDTPYGEINTDWQDAIFQDGLLTQNSLHLSGDNGRSSFFSSLGYLRQEGVMIGTPYERYNFRINSEHDISENGRFKFGQTLLLVRDERELETTIGGRTQLLQAVQSIPYQPIYNPNNIGGFSGADQSADSADPGNPVAAAELITATDQVFKLLGTAYLSYELLDGLEAQILYGANFQNYRGIRQVPIYESTVSNAINQIQDNRSNNYSPLYQGRLSFDRILGDHSINAVLVGEVQEEYGNSLNASVDQQTNALDVISGGDNPVVNGGRFTTVLQSIVGRATYGYQGRYFASVSFRRDGSSVFAPGNKFETFPAASIGWNISEEAFMADTPFSLLKARVSYGRTGASGPGAYSFQAPINFSFGPVFGESFQPNGAFINSLANENLRWEVTDMLNVGLDIGFFDNRLNFSMEYYDREVDNLILSVQLPPSVGVGSTFQNVGAMKNTGFEFQGQYYGNRSSDFLWDVSVNVSTNTNEVLRLASEDDVLLRNNDAAYTGDFNSTITRVGDPIYSFYGFQTDGLFQTFEEIDNANALDDDPTTSFQSGAAPGDIRFVDQNGDGQITSDDRVILGSYLPDFFYGVNFSATYRGFDFGIFLQGSQGNDVYNGMASLLTKTDRLFNVGTDILNAWTPDNTSTDVPRIALGDPNNNRRVSDRFLEDGSYLRLKGVTVGYRVPFGDNSILSNVRVYLTGQNLLTITGYSGLDPEVGGGLSSVGFDNGRYPTPRSFIFGAQVGF